jgi:hypothetical protein
MHGVGGIEKHFDMSEWGGGRFKEQGIAINSAKKSENGGEQQKEYNWWAEQM